MKFKTKLQAKIELTKNELKELQFEAKTSQCYDEQKHIKQRIASLTHLLEILLKVAQMFLKQSKTI